MMISKALAAAIMEQVAHEFQASHQYINIAAYFDSLALKGMAKKFYKQADEERDHAIKFIKYVSEAGGDVALPAIPAPVAKFASVKDAIALSLKWELEVTRRINVLMAQAIEEKDYLGQDFLRWFVSEQLEEVSTMENLLKVAEASGEKNLFMMEAYLAHD